MGLSYACNLLLLTTKFYFQNQPPKCRVDGYKFRSVYTLSFLETKCVLHALHYKCECFMMPFYLRIDIKNI